MTYRFNTTTTTTTEMQYEHRHSSHGTSRRHRSKEHKKSEKHVYYLFKNASERKSWARVERSQMIISGNALEKELARSREVGKDAETVMSLLPPTQLKHISKLRAELNEQEESSRYEWKVASLGQEKAIAGNTPSMWCIMHREKKERTEKKERKEKKEKKERTEKVSKSSKHGSKTNDLPALTHEELQQFFIQQYVVTAHTQCYQPSYVQPGGTSPSSYNPAQPAVQEISSTPSIGGIYSRYTSSESSVDSDSHSSGYSSDAESVSSNLTTASTASSSSNSSVATPQSPRAPLRGILKTKQPSDEVVIHNDASENSEQDPLRYSSVSKNPSAHSYIGTAPHAMKDFTESREKGYLAEYQLDTASNVTSSSATSRKTRFSDEASFCIAYDYESAEESEGDVYYREQEERRRRKRRTVEPGALAVSKYVQYGSD
ncbi:hypothetical protein L211DRAFT_37729 [Terfezia boudieri ATCC MYA-4762]|uniref:Uncharacterized protein n=1 Tax=Terfezia boudieri ATCC MYA-4762 TaxID=1051890 RepID=A0A3N4M3J9_9PEZI|nr:hypothetical protein L211DRAFT_37729 [Terfezia boudieri ATCC MYA-4762]